VVGGVALWRTNAIPRLSGPTGPTALDPAAFSPGACMAYAPLQGDRHRTVFLDAGHGGVDPGGIGSTEGGQSVDESQVNLQIELATMALLREDGFRVVVSRTANSSVTRLTPADLDQGILSLQGSHDDVVARDLCADLGHANVLVGIYMDSGASGLDAGSVAIYDDARPFAAQNEKLATLLQTHVLGAMNAHGWDIPNDGVATDATFGSYVGNPQDGGLSQAAANYDHLLLLGPAQPGYFENPSTMPGAVIEPLYLTDPFEGSIADSAEGQRVIARGLATAIEAFLQPPRSPGHPQT
jgi:N-acetylmuramoyl-L-alanine amidase